MIQSFSLSEDIIGFGADTLSLLKIIGCISLSFLPIIIPMSFLFSLLVTYSRLNMESELIAFRSLGISTRQLFLPAFILSLGCSFLSAQLSFYIAPWGQKKLAGIFSELAQSKIKFNLKAGVFSTDIKGVMVYVDSIDKNKTELERLFIFNELDEKNPVAIMAHKGHLKTKKDNKGAYGFLKLTDGSVYKTNEDSHTKLSFSENLINIYDPIKTGSIKSTPMLMDIAQIKSLLSTVKKGSKKFIRAQIEFHKRWALSLASILFSFIGFGIATLAQKRQSKSNGFVNCVALIVIYWLLFVSSESLAKSGKIPVLVSLWFANVLYLFAGLYLFRKSSRI